MAGPEASVLEARGGERGAGPEGEEGAAEAERDERGRPVRCAACRAVLTDEAVAIERDGAHAHTFFNPAGVLYEIACFAEAPGAALHGQAEAAFTWFSGWAWRIAVCARCRAHVGWRWERAGAGSFFGLAAAAIVRSRG